MTTATQQDDVSVLAVAGELNRATIADFRQLAERSMEGAGCDFVVDLVDCTGVDSAGLETLLWLSRTCQERLGMLKLCSLSDAVEKVLEITRLDQQLETCVTLDEAVAALKKV